MSEGTRVDLAMIVSKRLEKEDVTFIAGDVIQITQAWQIASHEDLRLYAEALSAEVARLTAENERLLIAERGLRSLEWAPNGGPDERWDFCHGCRQWRGQGHMPDCVLVPLLAALSGERGAGVAG